MKITRDLLKEMISEQIKRIRLNEADEMGKLAKMSPEEDQERMREIFIFGPEHMSGSSRED
jgi:hypothetical protein